MKARGLRNTRANTNVLQPAKMVTRAAIKRQPLSEVQRPTRTVCDEHAAGPVKQEIKQEIEKEVEQEIKQGIKQEIKQESGDTDDSLMAKYNEVGDVDKQGSDWKNSQLVACYVKEIFAYLRSLEPVQAVRRDFLCQPTQQEITPRMHKILFDWLVQVHQRFTLMPETLYLTFHIIDYYMSVCGEEVKKNTYQLLGVTAMFLASKYEEIYPPEITDFVFLTDNTYTVRELRIMERKLLSKLEFFIGYPLEIQFLRRYTKVSCASGSVHEMAKYLTELARSCYQLAHLPPSGLAAAGFCLACELLADTDEGSPKQWSKELEVFSGYTRDSLQLAVRAIARIVLQTQTEQKYTAVRNKYASKVFSCISAYPQVGDPSSPVLASYAK